MARVVVVTGGASGIGLAAARRFSAAGDRVAILDRNGRAAEAAAATLSGAVAVTCDVVSERQVADSISDVVDRLGRIDVLVNNAGIVGDQIATLDAPIEAILAILSVNLAGAYTVATEAARAMDATGGGVIVNTASLAGLVAVPNRTAYGASKAGLIDLTRSLACDWKGRGIRVNAVLPGFVLTEILAKLLRERNADPTVIEQSVPLGRLAEPDEVATVMEHFADATEATGATLMVDGGFGAFGGTGDASAGGKLRPECRPTGRHVLIVGGLADSMVRRFLANDDRVSLIGADAAAEGAIAKLGRVDVLVNRMRRGPRAGGDVSPTDFSRTVDRDLGGALAVLRAVAPGMVVHGAGSIVNLVPAKSGSRAQDAAAAGLVMATRSLACEWAAHGIRVNAVRLDDGTAADDAVAFLGSPAASYVTGALYAACNRL